ncbi:MAG: metallophosphoesterase [Promethearchaeota archaeon]
MRLAIISDTHYPWSLTKITVLASKFGYSEQFYENLEQFFKNLGTKVDALVFCGDFTWNLSTFPFSKEVLDQINPMWFFYPFVQLGFIRQWVNKEIPILMVEGNHEYWFDWVKSSENNTETSLNLNVEFFQLHLMQMNLSQEKITEIMEKLDDVFDYSRDYRTNTQFLGKNIHLLRNSGIQIGDYHFYGMPWYEKNDKSKSWSQIRYELIGKYQNYAEKVVLNSDSQNVIILHHRNPPSSDFIKDLNHPEIDIKAFYYGHYHGMDDALIDKYERNGPYVCVMPEKNNFKPVIVEI